MLNCIILFIMLCCFTIPAYGEYYKYEDSNGNIIFTDNLSNIPEDRSSEIKIIREPQGNQSLSGSNNPDHDPLPDDDSHEKRKKRDEESNTQLREYLKKESNAKDSCPPETREQAEQAIKTTWTRMAQEMVSGNFERALSFFSFFSRDEMKRRMSGMKQEEIKKIFSNYKSIEIESLYEKDGRAECGIIREEEDGESFSYPARFGRDIDCEWRIRGL